MAESIGATIKLDGEKEYRKAINEITQAQKTLTSEIKLAGKELESATGKEKDNTKQKELLNRKIEEQQKLLELQAPKVEYHDAVLASVSTYTTTQIAKEMGMSATALNKKLHELGVQYYQNGSWLLYAKYQDKGYTESETIKFNSKKGDTITKMVFKWTEEGRKFIHEKIKK